MSSFDMLGQQLERLSLLESVIGTLGWDESTMLPTKGAALRGAQQALLSGLAHEVIVDPRIEGWLADLDPADPIQRACARNVGRLHRRERNVPTSLVEELAVARSEGFSAWIAAKPSSDFERFAPALEKLLELSLRRAEAIDPKRHPYEVTLEAYDPGTNVAELTTMFARLRDGLTPLLRAIAERPAPAALEGPWPIEAQEALQREVAIALGYDFEGGRLDHAEHPFTSGHGPGDVRITTHLYEDDLLSGLGGTIHETGHALYEQGLPHEHAGTTVNEAASFGLHESQSRFFENFIGRSLPFSRWLAGRLEAHFPGRKFDPEALYRAQNRVERGLIRVQADEVTYNLHVIVRFELELALFERRLAVKDLPEAWNSRYAEVLGLRPPSHASGVLQDVHWSSGAFGYFPSYTLGNLYAASLGATLEAAEPKLWEKVEAGDFAPVLAFLRERVHRRGHVEEAPEIIRAAVGDRDHVEDLLEHLWGRHGAIYGVTRPPA